jgi:Uma2 family endonuclease
MENPQAVAVEPEQHYYTADEVRAFNRAEAGLARYECVFGDLLVSPGPTGLHQGVISRLLERLMPYLRSGALPYMAFTSPADISWGRDDVTVQPDIFVVGRDEAAAVMSGGPWSAITHLFLAVEVISPSSRRTDRFWKRRLYQIQNVPCYVTIDPATKVAETWTPEARFPRIERERLVWHPEGADEPLVIALADLFAEP